MEHACRSVTLRPSPRAMGLPLIRKMGTSKWRKWTFIELWWMAARECSIPTFGRQHWNTDHQRHAQNKKAIREARANPRRLLEQQVARRFQDLDTWRPEESNRAASNSVAEICKSERWIRKFHSTIKRSWTFASKVQRINFSLISSTKKLFE